MPRLIDADALESALENSCDNSSDARCFVNFMAYVDEQPTIDAVPVRWIPVTEEMPPPYVDVLVFGEYNRIAICYWCEDGNCFAHARDKGDVYFNVTHWMPLTCLMPKEVE